MEEGKPVEEARKRYTKGEEIFNVITHAAGTVLGAAVLVYGIILSLEAENTLGIFASIIYGLCMITTYAISSVYHSLKPNKGKRVLRVIDHCTVYLLILGTYTGILLTGIFSYSPTAAIIMVAAEWVIAALAITLTAVNMKKFAAFSMFCYIALGWGIIVIPHIVLAALSWQGFLWLLAGGICYTLGSVLYGIGRKKRYMHSVFHVFCIIGSVLQFVCFAVYCF